MKPVPKTILSVFFLIFGGMGLLFALLLLRESAGAMGMRLWPRVPVEIAASGGRLLAEAAPDEAPFRFEVRYRYEFERTAYESHSLAPGGNNFFDWAEVARNEKLYPASGRARAYVNPVAPAEAYLEPASLGMILFLPLPLLFAAIGFGALYGIWFYRGKPEPTVKAISAGARTPLRRGVRLALWAALTGISGAIFFGGCWRPAVRIATSSLWRPADCTVEFSRVGISHGDDGSTYRVDLLYTYEVEGVRYRSSRHRLVTYSSGGAASQAEAVGRLDAGSRTTCYVNPMDPAEAVIDRSFPFLFLFAIVPLAGFLIGARSLARLAIAAGAGAPAEPLAPVVLRPAVGGMRKFLGITALAVFWNGITGTFVALVADDWRSGDPSYFATLFLIPFVLIGLGLLLAVPHHFLALFGPRPRFTLTPGVVGLGSAATLQWSIRGPSSAMRGLQISLEGREEATYSRGTTSTTDKAVFHTAQVAALTRPMPMETGSVALRIPRDAMHTFEAPHNKVVWTLKVKGDVRWWPDFEYEFPVLAGPPAVRNWEV